MSRLPIILKVYNNHIAKCIINVYKNMFIFKQSFKFKNVNASITCENSKNLRRSCSRFVSFPTNMIYKLR